ncbi:MAG: OmpA family protein [Crocinitomicaceae bacterium]
MVKKGDFDRGLYFYRQSLKKDPLNYKANKEIGRMYLYTYQVFDSAFFYLDKMIALEKKDSNYYDYFDYANALRLSNQPAKAIPYYQLFYNGFVKGKKLDSPELEGFISDNLKFCENAIKLAQNPNNIISVYNMDFFINSKESEYTPVMVEEDSTLMYNARYKDLKSEKQFADYQYMENVYYFDLKESVASTFDENLGQGSHHAVVSKNLGSDTILLFYQNILWVGSSFQERLADQKPLPENLNDFYFQPHGIFTRDNKTFYFSAMKTESDNLDIYESNLKSDGTWSDPVKIKGGINTDKAEDSPFLSKDGKTLYFSSKGHNSSGGYDIFKSEFKDGEWSTPEALPVPYNSAGDDIYFVLSENEKYGYLSSNRMGGFGRMDIYKVQLTPVPTFDCPDYENIELLVEMDLSESIDTNSVPLSYTWIFEDGERHQGVKTSKVFRSPGHHIIRVDIADLEGKQVEKEEIYEEVIIDSVNFIGFKSNRYYELGETAQLDASVSYIEGYKMTNFFWKVDNVVLDLDTAILNLELTENRPYQVELQVFGTNGSEMISWCQTDSIFIKEKSDTTNNDFASNDNNDNNQNNSDTSNNVDDNNNNFINTDSVDTILNSNNIITDLDIKPIYFGFDKSNLTNKSIRELDQLIEYLNANPSAKVILEGHTDAMGSNQYNLDLAKKRIESALAYLKSKNIDQNRIIKTVSKGESDPAAPNTLADGSDNFNGRKMNRRVEFTIVK